MESTNPTRPCLVITAVRPSKAGPHASRPTLLALVLALLRVPRSPWYVQGEVRDVAAHYLTCFISQGVKSGVLAALQTKAEQLRDRAELLELDERTKDLGDGPAAVHGAKRSRNTIDGAFERSTKHQVSAVLFACFSFQLFQLI